MPLKNSYETPPEPQEEGTLSKLYHALGGIRGIAGTGIRGLSGVLSAEGGLLGAGISGAGELGAELAEGSTPSLSRIGVEAGLGAVPFGAVLKEGKALSSALRGAAHSGVGTAAREVAQGEDLNPTSIGLSALTGGAITGGLAKLLGKAKAPAIESKTPYVLEQQGYKGSGPITRNVNIGEAVPATEAAASAPSSRIPYGAAETTPSKSAQIIERGKQRLQDQFESALNSKNAAMDAEEAKAAAQKTTKANKLDEQFQTAIGKKYGEMDRAEEIAKFREENGLEPVSRTSTETISAPGESATTKYAVPKAEEELPSPTPTSTLGPLGDLLTGKGAGAKAVARGKKAVDIPPEGPLREAYETWIAQGRDPATASKLVAKGRLPKNAAWAEVGEAAPAEVAGAAEAVPEVNPTPAATPVAEVAPASAGAEGVPPSRAERLGYANNQPEVVEQFDKLGEAYDKASGPAKRALGKQLAELRDFLSGTKMRESWRGAPAEAGAAAAEGARTPSSEPLLGKGPVEVSYPHPPPPPDVPAILTNTPEEKLGLFEQLKKLYAQQQGGAPNPTSERGAISNKALASLATGGVGAAVGATQTPDNPLEGAAIGGTMGAALPFAPEMLAKLGNSVPEALANLKAKISNPEGKLEVFKDFVNTIPNIQRFNLLMNPSGLTANTVNGPLGSAFFGALEHGLAGDSRGWEALKKLRNPGELLRQGRANLGEAAQSIGRAEGDPLGENPSAFRKLLAVPGTWMTSGDITARNLLMDSGFSEEEARRITLTSEPELKAFKTIANFGKGPGTSEKDLTKNLLDLIFPFKRTPANIGEQGLMRMPGIGFAMNAMRENPDSIKQQIAQQLIDTGIGVGSYELGANVDPETGKTLRKFVTNSAGPHSLMAGAAFAAGQAAGQGHNPIAGVATGINDTLPVPSVAPLQRWGKYIASGGPLGDQPLPPGAVPGVIRDLMQEAPAGANNLGSLPSLRSELMRIRSGQ